MLTKLQRFLPQHLLSSFAGYLANCETPWIKNTLIQYFLWRYPVSLQEAANPRPLEYKSFNAFFCRALRPTARPIANGSYDIVSPADGQISQIGHINNTQLLQAKKHYFTLLDLLGGNSLQATPFIDGSFLTVYLAPENYHRVHMPIDGHLSHMIYIPGQLFSVNFKTAAQTPKLFARNERVVVFFDTSIGWVAIILVGAMIVGSLETVWAGTITPPHKKSVQIFQYPPQSLYLKKGEEMGQFKLGSTVIVLFEKNRVIWDAYLTEKQPIYMGQRVGTLTLDQ